MATEYFVPPPNKGLPIASPILPTLVYEELKVAACSLELNCQSELYKPVSKRAAQVHRKSTSR